MATNHLREIIEQGQAIWLDNISRALIEDGRLKALIDDDGISGVTSNPTIFEKAIGGSDRYEADLAEAARHSDDPEERFLEVALKDIRAGADLLRAHYDETRGHDGYVSFEVAPALSDDVEGTIASAKVLRARIDRANVMIKVPGTPAGVEAFEELTAAGVSINVTLLFAVGRYEEVAEAYIRGLERRRAAGERVDRIASVASFFVSRVDTAVDKKLEEIGRTDLAGKAAVANAKLAYASFQRIFSGGRWERLAAAGARVQRPLWASTSTKNPAYPDTMYVDQLIGPETVNTMPDATIDAARDHAVVARTIDRDVDAAREHIAALKAAGVDFDQVVDVQLVEEGVASFAKSYDSMIASIAEKARSLTAAGG